jgi:hypothetical protein
MRASSVVAFAALSLAAGAAHAGIVISYEDAMARHRDSLRTLVVCDGDGENHERWRVLEFDMEGQSFLYVDRLRVDNRDATWHHVEHFEFDRTNDNHAYITVRDFTCERDGDGVRVEGKARGPGRDDSGECEWTFLASVHPGRKPEWTESDSVCDVAEAE